jgi:hypothetical protein
MYTGVIKFDLVLRHVYNALYYSLDYIIACGKERKCPWLFLND